MTNSWMNAADLYFYQYPVLYFSAFFAASICRHCCVVSRYTA